MERRHSPGFSATAELYCDLLEANCALLLETTQMISVSQFTIVT